MKRVILFLSYQLKQVRKFSTRACSGYFALGGYQLFCSLDCCALSLGFPGPGLYGGWFNCDIWFLILNLLFPMAYIPGYIIYY